MQRLVATALRALRLQLAILSALVKIHAPLYRNYYRAHAHTLSPKPSTAAAAASTTAGDEASEKEAAAAQRENEALSRDPHATADLLDTCIAEARNVFAEVCAWSNALLPPHRRLPHTGEAGGQARTPV